MHHRKLPAVFGPRADVPWNAEFHVLCAVFFMSPSWFDRSGNFGELQRRSLKGVARAAGIMSPLPH